jgi:hypothetical protein
MKRFSHIWELMLFTVFITLVLEASQIMWAESVEEHHLKQEAAWTNKRLGMLDQ